MQLGGAETGLKPKTSSFFGLNKLFILEQFKIYRKNWEDCTEFLYTVYPISPSSTSYISVVHLLQLRNRYWYISIKVRFP